MTFKLRFPTLVLLLPLVAAVSCAAPTGENAEQTTEPLLTGTCMFGSGVASEKCMSVANAGTANRTNIRQWTCNAPNAQTFRVERLGTAARIVNVASGKCVDVDGAGTANFTNVQLYECNNTSAQSFRFVAAGTDAVRIVHIASNRCVDISGGATNDGANIQIYDCNNTNAQLWHKLPKGDPVKIMPLGASITQGVFGTHAGYRSPLDLALTSRGIPHLFVGSQTTEPGPLPPEQIHHEGHPGFIIAGNGQNAGLAENLGTWLGPNGAAPDVILLLVGSNDIGAHYDLPHAGDRMDALLTQIRGLRPVAEIYVATLPRINDAAEEALAVQYNASITAIAQRREAAGEPIHSVDVHAVVGAADKADNLHPNDAGYDKIAKLWMTSVWGD